MFECQNYCCNVISEAIVNGTLPCLKCASMLKAGASLCLYSEGEHGSLDISLLLLKLSLNLFPASLSRKLDKVKKSSKKKSKVKTTTYGGLQVRKGFPRYRSCAALLDLDADHVERTGALMCGLAELNDLSELEGGRLHEVTLVLQ